MKRNSRSRLLLRLVCLVIVVEMGLSCDSHGGPFDPDSVGPRTGAIHGTVSIGGSPVDGAQVSLTGPGGIREVITVASGEFAFDNLPAGLYTLAGSLGGVACETESAHIQSGNIVTASIDCSAAQPRLTTSISGTVDADGEPLGGVQVMIAGLVFTGALGTRTVRADTAGRFTFAELTAGTYTVTAAAPGFSCISPAVVIQLGQTITANISCAEDGSGIGEPPTLPPGKIAGKIAFERAGRIMVVDHDGSSAVTFIDGLAPSWSPDGKKLVFQRSGCPNQAVYPFAPCDDIWTVNADGSGLSPITSSQDVHDRDPVWSPDGSRVAFVRFVHGPDQDYLVVANADSPSPMWSEVVLSVWWPYARPNWSPDGTRIVFTCQGPSPGWEFDICVVQNRDTGGYSGGPSGVEKITNDTWIDSDPAWSPDGTWIAFTTNRGADGRSRIALIRPDGSGFMPLVPGRLPAWSPDGRRIVFVGGAGAPGLYVVDVDGSGLVRITGDPADISPSWGR